MAKLTKAQLEATIEAYVKFGGNAAAMGRAMKMDRSSIRNRLEAARKAGLEVPDIPSTNGTAVGDDDLPKRDRINLQDRIRDLETEIRAIHRHELTDEKVRSEIFGLASTAITPPSWAIDTPKKHDNPGIPSVLWSDWHWGEVVQPAQIGHVNDYNITIAKQRLRNLVSKTIALCFDHMVRPNYPGIVVNLGGDMVSGDIHDELSETNELASGQILIDITSSLTWALGALANRFGRVWVVGVPGNHGRMTHRPRFKDRQFTNFDWVIYHLLRLHFVNDERFTFYVPDGADAHYQVLGHKYLLTHGDNLGVKGGDGIIGSLGPILRGDFKIRNASAQTGNSYSTLLMGHWHQFLPLYPRLIVNGSLKGFDEFAHLALRAAPEPPAQALWFTHGKVGITSVWPVFVEEKGKKWTGDAVKFGMVDQ